MNNHLTSTHLTPDQFTDIVLLGEQDDAARHHLAACAPCRAELERFTESVGLFSATSLALCDAKPSPSLRAKAIQHSALQHSRQRLLLWSPLAVACAVLGVTLRVAHQPHPGISITSVAQNVPAADSPAAIAADNQLLENVNLALNSSESTPLPEERLFEETQRPHARAQ